MKPLNLCWTSWFLTCGTLKASHALKTASSCCPWTRSYLSLSAPALFSLSSLPAVDYKGEAHALQAGICESLTLAFLRWLGRSWKKKTKPEQQNTVIPFSLTAETEIAGCLMSTLGILGFTVGFVSAIWWLQEQRNQGVENWVRHRREFQSGIEVDTVRRVGNLGIQINGKCLQSVKETARSEEKLGLHLP